MGLIDYIKSFFVEQEQIFTASQAEFDSIACFAYCNAINCSYDKIKEYLASILSDTKSKIFLIVVELMHISRNCELILLFANNYNIKDDFEVSKMIRSLQQEAFNLAIEIYNGQVKDPIVALEEQLKRIDNREEDIKEFIRLIAKSELKAGEHHE